MIFGPSWPTKEITLYHSEYINFKGRTAVLLVRFYSALIAYLVKITNKWLSGYTTALKTWTHLISKFWSWLIFRCVWRCLICSVVFSTTEFLCWLFISDLSCSHWLSVNLFQEFYLPHMQHPVLLAFIVDFPAT